MHVLSLLSSSPFKLPNPIFSIFSSSLHTMGHRRARPSTHIELVDLAVNENDLNRIQNFSMAFVTDADLCSS